jgi:hypothetical protein
MHRSDTRILTTHVGSLVRTERIVELHIRRTLGEAVDASELMCEVALGYVRKAGVAHRIDALAVDMFREAWPSGYDAIFLSNIFHDWDFETCAALAAKAYAALSSGGRILLHEMLLDDTHDGPATAVAFSMYMLLGTKGQQFTAAELSKLLADTGFGSVEITPTHGYYAVVSGRKP